MCSTFGRFILQQISACFGHVCVCACVCVRVCVHACVCVSDQLEWMANVLRRCQRDVELARSGREQLTATGLCAEKCFVSIAIKQCYSHF